MVADTTVAGVGDPDLIGRIHPDLIGRIHRDAEGGERAASRATRRILTGLVEVRLAED